MKEVNEYLGRLLAERGRVLKMLEDRDPGTREYTEALGNLINLDYLLGCVLERTQGPNGSCAAPMTSVPDPAPVEPDPGKVEKGVIFLSNKLEAQAAESVFVETLDGTPFDATEEETPEPEPCSAAETEGKTYTKAEVREALGAARLAGVNVTELLRVVGVDRFTALPASRYGELMGLLVKEGR